MPSPADIAPKLAAPPGGTYADRFTPGLLDPAAQRPEDVTGPHGKKAEKRFDVYRNNVTVGLVNALASMFPATKRIVGEEFFRAMVKLYVRASPPRSRLLAEYGADLADFVEHFPPLAELPWLADVVRIERAWLDAYHAADAAPLAASGLAGIQQEQLGQLVFEPHPATRIVRSAWPAVTIFSKNREEAEIGPLDVDEGEDALITRPELDVLVMRLPAGGATFLEMLMSGATLLEAAAQASEEDAAFDIGANIGGMLEAGVFCAIRNASGTEDTGEIR